MIKHIKNLSEPKPILYLALAYTAFVTFLFLLPASGVPEVRIPGLDKLVHIAIFFGGSILWLWFTSIAKRAIINKLLLVCGVIFLYGIVIETFQELFFESRTADVLDILANTLGIVLGWLFVQKMLVKK